MLSINGNILNMTTLLAAHWTGHYKDDKKEYIILIQYPSTGEFVVATAYEREIGWNNGNYFHPDYEDLAFDKAKAKFNDLVKRYSK